jgi:photosystem II stability/assembly factor-like uncharacterized protein
MRRVLPMFLFACLLGLAAPSVVMAQAAATAPKAKGVWEAVNYGEDLSLTDVFFVTPDIGYVAGAAGTILKTTDAGATWTPQLGGDPESAEREIRQLWFISPTVGWATQTTSTHSNLLRTTDGENWSRVGQIGENYQDFAFASESVGVYVYNQEFFHTRDGGKTWKKTARCAAKAEIGGLTREIGCNLWKIRYATPTVAYALAAAIGPTAAVVLGSQDAGESWSVLAVIEEENASEGGLFFLDEKNGYFSTSYGKSAFRTTDGGLTWSGMPSTAIHRRIVFADPEVGWSMLYNQLSYTTDGGRRWSSRDISFPAQATAFSFPRRDRAYAVGDHGMIYRYSVVAPDALVSAKALAMPAMPALDNAVLTQLAQLDTRIDKISAALKTSDVSGDWANTPFGDQISQMQTTIDTVGNGVPAMGRKHRSLNLLTFGLQLLSDLSSQGNGLKEAFSALRQSKDLNSLSVALQNLNGQVDAMKTSVQTFAASKKSGG